MGGQRRDRHEHTLDLFAAQRHGFPRILWQVNVISLRPVDRGRPPAP